MCNLWLTNNGKKVKPLSGKSFEVDDLNRELKLEITNWNKRAGDKSVVITIGEYTLMVPKL